MTANSHFKLIALKTCFLKFCLFLICLIQLLCLSKCETCNNGLDLCQPLSNCVAYTTIPSLNYKSLNWCNKLTYEVCCPQLRSVALKIDIGNKIERTSEKECKKWQKNIYPICPPEGLISQGKDAKAKEFPHMALIGIYSNSKYDWFCGGSLISEKLILTAEHCLYKEGQKANRIRLGEVDYKSTTDDALIQEFTIKNFTSHPEYDDNKNYHDIALIEINGEVIINSNVVPICLPSTNGSENDRLYSAGWGGLGPARSLSSHLQKVILEVFTNDDCKRKLGRNYGLEDGINSTHQICAGSYISQRDTCPGDSGGPLFIEHAYRHCMFEIHGITSFGGNACGSKGSPTVYTRVLAYIDWIESVVWNVTNND